MEVGSRLKPCVTAKSTLLMVIGQVILFNLFAITSGPFPESPLLCNIAVGGILTAAYIAAESLRSLTRQTRDFTVCLSQVLLPFLVVLFWLFLIS